MSAFDAVRDETIDHKAMRKEFFQSIRADFNKANREIRTQRLYLRSLVGLTTVGAAACAIYSYVGLHCLFPDTLPAVPVVTDWLTVPSTGRPELSNLKNASAAGMSGLMTFFLAHTSNEYLKKIPALLSEECCSSLRDKIGYKAEIRYARDLARQRRFLQRGGYFDTTNIKPWQRIPAHEIRWQKFPTARVAPSPAV